MIAHIGDRVCVDHPKYPGVWIVKSQGPVNSLLEPESGGRRLRVPHTMLTTPRSPGATVVVTPTTFYDVGELVRLVEGRFAGLYAVIKDSGDDRVNIAKIGGDGGRYVRAFRNHLVKVDTAEVLK